MPVPPPHPPWGGFYLHQPMLQPAVYPHLYRLCQGMGWQGHNIAGWPLQLQPAPTLLEVREVLPSTQLDLSHGYTLPWAVLQQVFVSPHSSLDQELIRRDNSSAKARHESRVCDGDGQEGAGRAVTATANCWQAINHHTPLSHFKWAG